MDQREDCETNEYGNTYSDVHLNGITLGGGKNCFTSYRTQPKDDFQAIELERKMYGRARSDVLYSTPQKSNHSLTDILRTVDKLRQRGVKYQERLSTLVTLKQTLVERLRSENDHSQREKYLVRYSKLNSIYEEYLAKHFALQNLLLQAEEALIFQEVYHLG